MRKRASITAFSALSMMLIASFLFALLEAARVQGLNAYAELTSKVAMESTAAEYQPLLWKDYHLLGLDAAYGGTEFSVEKVRNVLERNARENLELPFAGIGGSNLLQLQSTNASIGQYQLMPDAEGNVFLKQVSAYMQKNIARDVAQRIYDDYCKTKEVEDTGGAEYSVEDAQKAIEDARKAEAEKAAENTEQSETTVEQPEIMQEAADTEDVENPLEIVTQLKENAILGMVVEDMASLSENKLDLSQSMMRRELEKGTNQETPQINWYDKVLTVEYMDKHFSSYIEKKENTSFVYEIEYLLCGEDTDKANLEGVINRLLLMREVANVSHILSDSVKRNEAMTFATALAGFSGNPVVIKIVQIGVVAAWAYVESILDVRALLHGEKIALLKNTQQWTADVKNLAGALQNHARAKACENGIDYMGYLKQLVFFMGTKKLAYRMMDIMEHNIRTQPAYENYRMDYTVCSVQGVLEYKAKPVFASFVLTEKKALKNFAFCKTEQFNYVQ